jgi:hypothetical protein
MIIIGWSNFAREDLRLAHSSLPAVVLIECELSVTPRKVPVETRG